MDHKIEQVNISEIKPYPKNAKKHTQGQVKQIAASIKEFGFNQPLVLDKDGVVIVGHGRYLAAQELGLKKVPVLKLGNLTEEQVKAYRLADNRLNESEWDFDLVIEELKGLDAKGFNIELTGFDKEMILDSDEAADHIPDAPKKAKTRLGDIYQLGDHRLICGDSTDPQVYKDLLGDTKANLVFTSPPYNMNAKMYQNYKDNLKSQEYIEFNLEVINLIKDYLKGFIFWNVSYNKNSRWEFLEILSRMVKETGLQFLEMIIWNKKRAMPITSTKMLTRQYEDILLAGDPDAIKEDMEIYFCGENDKGAYFNKKTRKGITNYWEISVNKTQLENHSACFPVNLPLKGILLMSEQGGVVLDPFGGSGSTLIAAEKAKRKCFMIELDPIYCDVIVKRWEIFTGKKAKLLK